MTDRQITRGIFELVAIIALIYGAVYVLIITEPKSVKIDCRIAEISPDYSQNIKEMCRKLK